MQNWKALRDGDILIVSDTIPNKALRGATVRLAKLGPDRIDEFSIWYVYVARKNGAHNEFEISQGAFENGWLTGATLVGNMHGPEVAAIDVATLLKGI